MERRLADPKPLCNFTGGHELLAPLDEESLVESIAMHAINVRSTYSWKDSCSSPALERQISTLKQGRCRADRDIAFDKRQHILAAIPTMPLGSNCALLEGHEELAGVPANSRGLVPSASGPSCAYTKMEQRPRPVR
jgi:hypothetical protein